MTSGRDHSVTAGEGGAIVRRRLRPDGEGLGVEQEAALLALVAGVSPVPVPRVIEVVADEQTMVMERLPGEPLLDTVANLPESAARRIGAQLGKLVAALGRVPSADVRSLVPVEPSPLADYHRDAVRLFADLREALPETLVPPLADFLAAPLPAPARRLRLCHNDLGAEHVFVQSPGDRVTGVIDWSDASLADPSLDLGLIWRDLGEVGFVAALQQAELDEDDGVLVARARFFARVRALEDVEFGLETGRQDYLGNATRALRRLF